MDSIREACASVDPVIDRSRRTGSERPASPSVGMGLLKIGEDRMRAFQLVSTLATHEALAAGHREITVAHLLLGLARASEVSGRAGQDFMPLRRELDLLGIEPGLFRSRLRALTSRGGVRSPRSEVRPSASCREIMERAQRTAAILGTPVGPEHLLRAAIMSLAGDSAPDPGPSSRSSEFEVRGPDVPSEL